MRLGSLEVLPRGAEGWGVGPLPFGTITTLIFGPNGAGKTPLIKLLVYCLGHPVELPPLIRERCGAVVLMLVDDAGMYRVERRISDGVDATITTTTGSAVVKDEKTLSEWVLSALGVSLRTLAGLSTNKVPPYVSVAAPAFFVDQDAGWTDGYVPIGTNRILKDQREEVYRWLLGLPARNRAVDQKALKVAKTNLDVILDQIGFKRCSVEMLTLELGEIRLVTEAALVARRIEVEALLSSATSVFETASRGESVLDVKVREAVERRDRAATKLANAERRKSQLAQLRGEVGVELQAIEQNEVAAEAFRNLCGSDSCQFFRRPEESYGRRVLYLKDQLKDFESTTGEIEREVNSHRLDAAAHERAVTEAIDARKRSLAGNEGARIAQTVDALSRELSDITVRLDRLQRVARERAQLDALIKRAEKAGEEVEELKPARQGRRDSTGRVLDARHLLAKHTREWLLALRAPNLSSDVTFDEALHAIIGGEKFSARSSHSGSTRTRIALALHAALLETSLVMGGVHPRLLVLDAPRQHELHPDDLRSFFERFYSMAVQATPPVQLIYTAVVREVAPVGQVDQIWEPGFVFDGKPRFLGRTSPPAGSTSASE